MWITGLMAPVVQNKRSKLGCRVLTYLDDLLVAPSRSGAIATLVDCE